MLVYECGFVCDILQSLKRPEEGMGFSGIVVRVKCELPGN